MWQRTLILGIASSATLIGCASPVFTPPSAMPPTIPLECKTRCPPPPPLKAPRETWEAEFAAWAFKCEALHRDCVKGLDK